MISGDEIKSFEDLQAFWKKIWDLVGAGGSYHVTVVTGDAQVGRLFASLPFDHLLFTGSTAVGRDVMRAAAEAGTGS